MRLIEKTKRILSLRSVSIIVVLLSIAGRIIQKLSFFGLGDDKLFQLQAAKNMLAGHGISISEVMADNLSVIHYTPLIRWPPGYSLFASPFLAIDGDNFLFASVGIDLMAALCYVLLARRIVLLLNLPLWQVNIYTLVTGFFLYDFFHAESSDLVALVLVQFAIYFILKFLKSPEKKSSAPTIIVFFLFAACLMRYMYIPVMPVLPAYVLLAGFANNKRLLIRTGFLMLISLMVLIGALMLFQKMSGGDAVYMFPVKKGFFPENILSTAPFFLSAVGNFTTPAILLKKISGWDLASIANAFIYVNLLLMGFAILAGFIWVYRKKFKSTGLDDHFTYLVFFSSIAVVGTLTYLSLTNAKHPLGQYFWTYVLEPRYFALPVFLIQLWLFVYSFRNYTSNKIKKFIAGLLLVILLGSTLHGVYYTMKQLAGGNKNLLGRTELVNLESCHQLFSRFLSDNAGKNIVCASGDPMFNNFAAFWGGVPSLYDYKQLNSLAVQTQKPTLIFVPVKDWYASKLKGFLANPSKKFIGQVGEWSFYSIEINP